MSDHIASLIDQLITAAKSEGISQAELAARAGLSPVGLSKAKRRGNLHATTLAALGRGLDLELVFMPRSQAQSFFEPRPDGSLDPLTRENPEADPITETPFHSEGSGDSK